jgi:alpha-glucosidase
VIAEQVIGVGATGFMADFAEYTPFDSVLDKGSAAKQHSRWPQLWADTVKEACNAVACRTAWPSSARATWARPRACR